LARQLGNENYSKSYDTNGNTYNEDVVKYVHGFNFLDLSSK
jgi:hypothetical protein